MEAVTAVLAVEYAGLSVSGHVRDHNEDRLGWAALDGESAFVMPPQDYTLAQAVATSGRGLVFAVADGLGGYGGGEVASGLAVEACLDHTQRNVDGGGRLSGILRGAFNRANQAIFDAALGGHGGRKMQSTLSALAITPGEAHLAHVGDSRAYLIRASRIYRLTTDHSAVQSLLNRNLITPEEAQHHPDSSVLTRCLGQKPEVEIDIEQHPLASGDTLLLCSDGLWGFIPEQDILSVVETLGLTVEAAARNLLELALAAGGHDNIGIEMARLIQPPDAAPLPRTESYLALRIVLAMVLIALAALCVLAYLTFWNY